MSTPLARDSCPRCLRESNSSFYCRTLPSSGSSFEPPRGGVYFHTTGCEQHRRPMQGAGKHLWVLESFLGGIVKTRDVPSDSAVKSLRAMQETQETRIRSLGREDPWRRARQPTPVFLPGESHGQRSLAGYRVRHG